MCLYSSLIWAITLYESELLRVRIDPTLNTAFIINGFLLTLYLSTKWVDQSSMKLLGLLKHSIESGGARGSGEREEGENPFLPLL